MPNKALGRARVLLHGVLSSERGNALPPLRLARRAVSFVNDLAGRPLCSEEELQQRQERLTTAEAALRDGAAGKAPAAARREPAPVVVYMTDADHRTPKKIGEVLKARDIPYKVSDVTDDEATRSWALTQAQATEFPLVFIAGESVGGLHELTQLDVTGKLVKKVFG
jgi:glutaredoxin